MDEDMAGMDDYGVSLLYISHLNMAFGLITVKPSTKSLNVKGRFAILFGTLFEFKAYMIIKLLGRNGGRRP